MIQTRVDDRDGRIQYSQGWGKAGSKVEYLGTTTSTTTKGAQFTFSFYGTSIKVFGTLAGTTGSLAPVLPDTITSYTVDGGDPVLFSGKPGNDAQYNQQFFSSGDLSNSTHTIVGTCVNGGSPVYIDYLVVGAPTPESISSPPVSITWAHSQPATPTRLLATESSSLPTSIASPYTTPPVATIIGSIAGGFTLVVIAFALFLWYCRRKRMESIRHRRSFSLYSRGLYTPSQSLSKSDSNSLVSLPSDIIIYREGRRSLQSQPVSLSATSWYGDKLY
ncbi:hypothetical protein CCMSSC00406_0003536 [Pleurotus cornucopiae]|uniref:Uncharacterized protein n=1 Tax=Pleurotus cornucopiae TaxID=5321 RepID=A0ACB7II09_PLECO|nr:hypothetical protein CCMSSC00406_0003536 [Pleurotus cornucopiae]